MAQKRTRSLLALLILFLAAGAVAQPVLVEDVSPDGEDYPGAPSHGFHSASGLIAAVDGSGPERVAGPPTSWSSRNGPDWVEHVAAVDSSGHLKVFYRQPKQEWKAVDVTEKTGASAAVEQPAAWLMPEGGETDEKLAVRSPTGELLVFRWRSGSDWQVENLTQRLGRGVLGAASAWVSSAGGRSTEYIAARGTASQLLVFYRAAGSAWKFVDVTAKTGGGQGSMALAGPTGWTHGGVEYVAASSPQSRLLLFAFDPFNQGWTVESITAAAHTSGGPIPWVEGRVEAWTVSGQPRLAARALDGALLVFTRDAIDSRWSFEDVSATTRRTIATAPTFWESGSGGGRIEHLAAADADGRLVVFYRGSGPWKAVDVGAITGRTTRQRPTSWVTPDSAPPFENVASTSPGGNLVVSSWRPGRDWIAENASRLASGRVLYAASQKAGVWRSDDYGRFWRQLTRPQPAGKAALSGTLDVPVVLDVAVNPTDHRIVLVGTGSDHRTRSRAGLYRSTNGGASWQRVASFARDGEVLPVSQVTFAPDDPNLAFAVGGSGIDASLNGGRSWEPLLRTARNRLVWHVAVSEADPLGRRSLAALGPRDLWFASGFEPSPSSRLTADWVRDDSAVFGAGLPATASAGTGGTSSHVMTFVPGSSARVLIADQHSRNKSAPRYYGKEPNGTPTPLDGLGSLWDVDLSRFEVRNGTLHSTWDAVPLPAIYTGAGSSGVTYVYTHRTAQSYLVFFANENTVHVSEGVASATRDWHRLDGLDASQSEGGNQSLVHPDPHDLLVSASFELDLEASGALYPFDQDANLGRCGGGRLWMANDGGVVHSTDCGREWEAAEDGLDTLNFINVAVSPRKSGDDVRPYLAPSLYGGTTHTDQSFSPDGGATWKPTATGCGDCDAWFSDPAQPSHVLALMPRSKAFHLYVDSRGGPDASKKPTVSVPYPDYVRPFAISFKVMEGYRPIVYSLPGEANLPGGDYITLMVEGRKVGGRLQPGKRVLLRARDTFTSQSGSGVWEAVSGRAEMKSNLPPTVDVVQAAGGHRDTEFFVGDGKRLWRSERDADGTIEHWELLFPDFERNPDLVAAEALRYFVNPYDPREVYVVSADAVRHTTDGGTTWPVDHALDDALTESDSVLRQRRRSSTGGSRNPRNATRFDSKLALLPGESENLADELILNDMVFDRGSSRRFAIGLAGVFFSPDGKTWRTLIDSRALPGRPRAAWFDAVSDPSDQSLYVAYHGRGILQVHPIPPASSPTRAEMQSGTMEAVPLLAGRLFHYHWCERQSPAIPDAETAERRRLLTQCGVPVGQ